MEDKYKHQSNFLVAILAVVVGLGIFRNEITNWNVNLFGVSVTGFTLVLAGLGLLLFAVYLYALVFFVLDNINFTKFPLKKYVLFIANLCVTFTLLSPLFLLFAWPLSWLLDLIKTIQIDRGTASEVSSLVSVLLSVIASSVLVFTTQKQNEIKKHMMILQQESEYEANRKQHESASTRLIEGYNQSAKLLGEFLESRGYGVKNVSFHHLVKIMVNKGFFDEDDIEKSRSISATRNMIIHGRNVKSADIERSRKYLVEILRKFKIVLKPDQSDGDEQD